MSINQPVQKIIAWTKDHPLMAGGLVVGAVGLGYLASKNMNKLSLVPTGLVDDAAGAGVMGGGEDKPAPLVPYVDFDPVSGIPLPPASNGGRSDDGDDDPSVYTWIPEILEDVLPGGGGFWGDFDVSVFDNVTVESGRPVVSDPSTPYQDERIHDLSYLFAASAQTPYQDERVYDLTSRYTTPDPVPTQTPYQDERQYTLPQFGAPPAAALTATPSHSGASAGLQEF